MREPAPGDGEEPLGAVDAAGAGEAVLDAAGDATLPAGDAATLASAGEG